MQDPHSSSLNHQPILAEETDCLGEAAMLHGKDASGEQLLVIFVFDIHTCLNNHRTGVHTLIHEMDGAARHPDPIRERLPLGVQTGERREKGRMDIDQPAME